MRRPLSRRTVVAAAVVAPLAAAVVARAQQAAPLVSPAASPSASPAASGGDPVTLAQNKQLVAEATDALFNRHDESAVDRYIGSTYTQHSTLVGEGPETFRQLVAGLDEGVAYEAVRLLADGDLAAAHGRYTGFGEAPLVAVDIFRVVDGKLVEHWDGLQPETGPNPSGHTMLDGPTMVSRPEQTEASRTLVEAFVDAVLISGQYDRLPEFVSTERYIQHSPQIADDLDGLGVAVEALAEQGITLHYNARHRTVAEGDFVLVQSDGDFGGPVVYYDLFRVEDGKIVEHWDVIQQIPAQLPHDNGLF